MNAGADGWSRRRDVCRPIARRQTMKTPEEDGEFEVDTHSSITHKALHQKLMFVKFQKLNRSQDKKKLVNKILREIEIMIEDLMDFLQFSLVLQHGTSILIVLCCCCYYYYYYHCSRKRMKQGKKT